MAERAVEAEDVFEPDLIEDFVTAHGRRTVTDGSTKRPDGAFHYDFGQVAKESLGEWLREKARPEHVEKWIELILLVRTRAGLDVPDESAADLVAAADRRVVPVSDAAARHDALVISGQHDYARYQDSGAIVVDADLQIPATVTHIAFYDRAIQPQVALILADHRNRLFSPTTAQQLRATGQPGDASVADVIEAALSTDSTLVGSSHRVLVLSAPDAPETVVLPNAIDNTKTLSGRPVAWTIGPKAVPVWALEQKPATTDALDALIATEGPNP